MVPADKTINGKSERAKYRLTINERILLHLLDNFKSKNKREAPQTVTQRGIADGVHIRWNHVPRAMNQLKKMELVFERTAHIEGKTRRQKVYYLTDDGMFSARNLRERVLNWDILLKKLDGQTVKLKLSDVNLELKTDFSPLSLSMSISEEGIIDATELLHPTEIKAPKTPPKTFFVSGEISWPKELIGRETEIETLQDWIDKKEFSTIIIYGSIGIGKSALAAEVLKGYKDKRDIFWYQMSEQDRRKNLLVQISEFLSKIGKAELSSQLKTRDIKDLKEVLRIIDKGLKDADVILAFDNYFKVTEDILDFFSGLTDLAVKNEGFTMIVTARETTPFYCRFYDKADIQKKRIAELTLKGLDMEGCKELLGTPNIDDDSLRKIHLMTRGHPLTIELIKKGDVNSLKRIKGFSRQEASLLLYLKGVEKK